LWELPAGKLDPGEDALDRRHSASWPRRPATAAKKWAPLVEYYASPGFLGESMKVFIAEGLVAGDAHPEDDEDIDFRLVKLSEVLKMIEKGEIKDGKTLTGVLLYARLTGGKQRK
jgi:ADP-ribose pyrophosphatase